MNHLGIQICTLLALLIAVTIGILFGPSLPGVKGHEEFAGALIGAGGTVLAGVIAWIAVQRQIESTRQLTKEREQDTFEVICAEFRPYVDLYVQVWRVIQHALGGDAERKRAGISLIKAFATDLAVDDRAQKIEEMASELDPRRRAFLVDLIHTFKMLDAMLKGRGEDDRFWLLNVKTMLSHFERKLSKFDPNSARLFDAFEKAPLDYRSSAEHVKPLIDNFIANGVVQ